VIGLLHERLPELRKQHGLSQNDLADLIPGVSVDTVRKYELKSRAGTIPDAEILEAMAAALNLGPAEAFYEYPIALARREARPGVSQRKAKGVTPSDELLGEVEAEAQRRDRRRTSPASSSKRKKGSGRAA
jgi:transcriptional regulator with XRE-family HTH domain